MFVIRFEVRCWGGVARQDPNLCPKGFQHPQLSTIFRKCRQQTNVDFKSVLNTGEHKRLPLQHIVLERPLLVHLFGFHGPYSVHVLQLTDLHVKLSRPSFSLCLSKISFGSADNGAGGCHSDNNVWVQKIHGPSLRCSLGRSYEKTCVNCALDLLALLQIPSPKDLSATFFQDDPIPLHHCHN